jgi:hypothetical protein
MNRNVALASLLLLAACAAQPDPKPQPAAPPPPSEPAPPPPPAPSKPTSDFPLPTSDLKEVFPHVRLDAKQRLIELDGTVPIDTHSDKIPRVYLEVSVCTPDSKEHETLVVTKALPSNLHATLLLANFNPGKPGAWKWEGEKIQAIPPTGDQLAITVSYSKDGEKIEAPITDWVIDAVTHKTMTETAAADHWVFAGSRIVHRQGRDWYSADGEGTMIGLTTFGGETIAWSRMYNPDSGVETPHWIAYADKMPPVGTAVVVRIKPAAQ